MNQNEKNNLINEIGNVAATSGEFSDAGLNLETEKELENQLSIQIQLILIYIKKQDLPQLIGN